MNPHPGGVTALCGICGTPIGREPPRCRQAHQDHCHECHARNLSQGFDAREHRPPVPSELVLTPRDVAALRVYQRHVERVDGTGPCTPLVREEEPHG